MSDNTAQAKPPDTPDEVWVLYGDKWFARPSPAKAAKLARAERDRRLAECDWVVTASIEKGAAVSKAWKDYRQALRDVTQRPGFPDAVEWPTPPGPAG